MRERFRSRMKTSRKVSRIVGVCAALFVVVAFSAIALASSASAAVVFLLAEWLNNGVALTSTVLGESSSEVLLEDTKVTAAGGAAVSVKCKYILDSDFGLDGAEDITEMLTIGGGAVSLTPLTASGLSCEKESLCEASKVWVVNLPWLGLLELWEEGASSGFVILLKGAKGNLGWYMECTILGVKGEDECSTPEAAAEASKNTVEGVEAIFSEAVTALFGLKLVSCTASGNSETGIIEGAIHIRLSSGGPLSVSE